ncbi:MAG: hypothetical protein MSC45_03160 [Mobiluncus sp.]|uniref:hypothetical protein n=1 Tax=Mobiluncus sp. TaxID=47293 RepID=UPI00258B14C3|nr:hypothetical protein [Mobiluncus sp.]MCI6584056.1 hypothetical protein [Mobiluncus sp.]
MSSKRVFCVDYSRPYSQGFKEAVALAQLLGGANPVPAAEVFEALKKIAYLYRWQLVRQSSQRDQKGFLKRVRSMAQSLSKFSHFRSGRVVSHIDGDVVSISGPAESVIQVLPVLLGQINVHKTSSLVDGTNCNSESTKEETHQPEAERQYAAADPTPTPNPYEKQVA